MKLIPFYRQQGNNMDQYTLFLDKEENRIYKVNNRDENNILYWVAFVLVLAIFRAVSSIHLLVYHPIAIVAYIMIGLIIFITLGIFVYKVYYRDLKEVYLTEPELMEYIKRGKKSLKIEVWLTGIMFILFTLTILLFLVNYWIVWYLVNITIGFLLTILICGLPPERFKLSNKLFVDEE
ncbi:hypothetical protein QNH47_19105 [Virgibacillus halodenitrificans]|uniref:hypothetical protein n=1 Tax=Virgibacillus halodenitrificans TaxID=1482 RepID=UPI0024BFAD8D|nr:hypothetical protein [Virgibacillus halodenitrificans]WHX26213.1 hypothetical protein QNH47_19105 [Virgibacillus halodenitrificans]